VKDEIDLTFLGFVTFLDPPKDSTGPAITELMSRGIELKVLTGDSPLVCQAVCKQIKLPIKGIVTTDDLRGLTPSQLCDVAQNSTIFARLTPVEKANVVTALQKRGHIVGFLGDGINDSVALRAADVGISVDEAVDVAKESADIILLEKSLMVLARGVVLGRMVYYNTIKYIKMAVSSNFGNVFSITIASAWLPFLPILPSQIVISNLLYDLSQIAIPWDNVDPYLLKAPAKWNVRGIMKFMFILGPISSILDITTFIFLYYYFGIQTPSDNVGVFQTAWFVEGLMTQTLIIHMIRTAKIPFIQSRASWAMFVGTATIVGICLSLPFIPVLNGYLGMTPLPAMFFPYLFGAIIGYCILSQITKVIYIRIFKEWL